MKSLFTLTVLALGFAHAAHADVLLCASKKNETLYYTSGQVRLTAEIANTDLLTDVTLNTTGSRNLGLRTPREREIRGKIKGNYVRFEIGSDAWCDYKLALPKNFMGLEKTRAYVDAYCEENSNSNIRLFCEIQ